MNRQRGEATGERQERRTGVNAFRQLELLHRAMGEPLDLTTQVDRFPPVDAPCPDPDPRCDYPFCTCYAPADERNE